MKNVTVTVLAPLLQDAQQTFTVQNKPAAEKSHKGNHHPSFLRFWIGQKKTVDAAKICGGAEKMLLKQKPSKHS